MELVGVVRYGMTGGNPGIAWHVQRIGVMPKEGESLYVGEPIDIAAIREVITCLNETDPVLSGTTCDEWADKLARAIGNKGNGVA